MSRGTSYSVAVAIVLSVNAVGYLAYQNVSKADGQNDLADQAAADESSSTAALPAPSPAAETTPDAIPAEAEQVAAPDPKRVPPANDEDLAAATSEDFEREDSKARATSGGAERARPAAKTTRRRSRHRPRQRAEDVAEPAAREPEPKPAPAVTPPSPSPEPAPEERSKSLIDIEENPYKRRN